MRTPRQVCSRTASSVAALLLAWVSATACASEDKAVFGGVPSVLPDSGTGLGTGGTGTGGAFATGGSTTATGGGFTQSTGGAATGGAAPTGSCDPNFCPSDTMGTPCCVGPNGPCGHDFGMGCIGSESPDGGP